MRIAILSDTHMPRLRRELSSGCLEQLAAAELIIHAGDLCTLDVLRELESINPVVAVRGNVDDPELHSLLPETLSVPLGRHLRLGLVHDAGPARGRLARMARLFPRADAVVFGHSHLPLHERGADGFQIFNPGSPTERRRAPRRTMGLARTTEDSIEFELVDLGLEG